jgi:hypothetical protein
MLSQTLDCHIRFSRVEPLDGRPHVLRASVMTTSPNAPRSFIIKCAERTKDQPFDPEDARPFSLTSSFFNEWAGLQLLTHLFGDSAPCPRFLVGDYTLGFIIMEDLGSGNSLEDILMGDDADRAETALLTFAETLGKLHATTVGQVDEYTRLRSHLSDGLMPLGAVSAKGFPEYLQEFLAACRAVGVKPIAGFEDEFEEATFAMLARSPFWALTHGDLCPGNNRYIDGRLRFLDFERCGIRHALLEGVYPRVPFPTCPYVNRLPAPILQRMDAIYRSELEKGCLQAGDDAHFQQAVVKACACWLVIVTPAMRGGTWDWHLSGGVDKQWGTSTMRQRTLLRLDSFAALAQEFGCMAIMGGTARLLAERLRSLWPPDADQMPLYSAFRGRTRAITQ